MDELLAQAEDLGIKVDGRWTAETLQEKIDEALDAPIVGVIPAPTPGMFPVKLLKNYKPRGLYEIVGDPVLPPYPGVGQEGKLWAGTTVRLPAAEAKALIENELPVIEKTKSKVTGETLTRRVNMSQPIAERMDAIPV